MISYLTVVFLPDEVTPDSGSIQSSNFGMEIIKHDSSEDEPYSRRVSRIRSVEESTDIIPYEVEKYGTSGSVSSIPMQTTRANIEYSPKPSPPLLTPRNRTPVHQKSPSLEEFVFEPLEHQRQSEEDSCWQDRAQKSDHEIDSKGVENNVKEQSSEDAVTSYSDSRLLSGDYDNVPFSRYESLTESTESQDVKRLNSQVSTNSHDDELVNLPEEMFRGSAHQLSFSSDSLQTMEVDKHAPLIKAESYNSMELLDEKSSTETLDKRQSIHVVPSFRADRRFRNVPGLSHTLDLRRSTEDGLETPTSAADGTSIGSFNEISLSLDSLLKDVNNMGAFHKDKDKTQESTECLSSKDKLQISNPDQTSSREISGKIIMLHFCHENS